MKEMFGYSIILLMIIGPEVNCGRRVQSAPPRDTPEENIPNANVLFLVNISLDTSKHYHVSLN